MGGGGNGGRMPGEQVKVEQPTLFQNRDYPVLTDYRAVFADLFRAFSGWKTPAFSGFLLASIRRNWDWSSKSGNRVPTGRARCALGPSSGTLPTPS